MFFGTFTQAIAIGGYWAYVALRYIATSFCLCLLRRASPGTTASFSRLQCSLIVCNELHFGQMIKSLLKGRIGHKRSSKSNLLFTSTTQKNSELQLIEVSITSSCNSNCNKGNSNNQAVVRIGSTLEHEQLLPLSFTYIVRVILGIDALSNLGLGYEL